MTPAQLLRLLQIGLEPMKTTLKDIPFSPKDLDQINFKDFKIIDTGRRFEKINGVYCEIPRILWHGYYSTQNHLNPAYDVASFAEAGLSRKKKGKFRVQQIRILYARVVKPTRLKKPRARK